MILCILDVVQQVMQIKVQSKNWIKGIVDRNTVQKTI